MSTLWTPEGEHRIPNAKSGQKPASESLNDTSSLPDLENMTEEQIAEMVDKVRGEVLNTPAIQIILNHLSGLAELAAIHLSVDQPDLESAKLAIDCLEAIVEKIKDKVDDEISNAVTTMLSQLQVAWVNASK